jgi:hypothetical protein
MTTMVRMVTPNTNITAGSINTTFLGDKSVTGAKIATTGALDKQVLSYDVATDTVIWQDVSYLDNTFENGIVVTNAQSTFFADVRIDGDIDLNGDLAISGNIIDLNAITASNTFTLTVNNNGNLTLDPAGHIHADTGNLYVGSFSQAVHITPTSIGAIGSALTFTGNLTGDVLAERIEINESTAIDPGNWTQYSYNYFDDTGINLAIASDSIPFVQLREYSNNNTGFGDVFVLKRSGDISTMTNDLFIHTSRFIETNGGGARRTSELWTRLRDLSVTGTGTSDYQYDEYKSHLEFIVYDKSSGNTESANAVIIASTDETQIQNELQIVGNYGAGNESLSNLSLRYEGTISDSPDAYISLEDFNASERIDMVRYRKDGSTYKAETKVEAYFEKPVILNDRIQLDTQSADPTTGLAAGQMYFNTSTNKFRGYDGTNWVDLN